MFESLITQILNKVLGDFIENIDPGQLKISIGSGKVNLQNMKLKSTLFDSMPLPFKLVHGQVGKIHLQIPVWNMFKSPLIIEVENVFGFVRPKRIDEWKEEVEIKDFQSTTQTQLDRYEVFQQNANNLKKKDPGTIDKLIVNIIDNIQVSIKNIYFRYEDDFTAPKQGSGKFAIGVILKELSAFTTNESWKSKEMSSGKDVTFKLGLIKGLTVFLDYDGDKVSKEDSLIENSGINLDAMIKDSSNQEFLNLLNQEIEEHKRTHKYILYDFQLEARLQINKAAIKNMLPQIDLDLMIGGTFKNLEQKEKNSINLQVHQPQIMRALKLLEFIGYYNEFQQGALVKFKQREVGTKTAKQYIELYIHWKANDGSKKTQKEADVKRKEMKELENDYSYEKLITLRKFGEKMGEQKAAKAQEQKEIAEQVKSLEKEKKGWFQSKEKKQQIQEELEQYKKKLQEDYHQRQTVKDNQLDEELQELTNNLQDQEDFMNDDFSKLPNTYVRFFFKVSLPSLQLTFTNEFEQNICMLGIDKSSQKIQIGNGFTFARFILGSITLKEDWTKSEYFPTIIETKSITKSGTLEQDDEDTEVYHALKVDFESNKEFELAPFKLNIETTKTIFVIANLPFIKEIQRSILAALQGETLDFTFFYQAASQTAVEYMQQGKDFMESIKKGEYEHQALDITVYLSAPIVIIPQQIYDPQKPCIIVDTGILEVNSFLTKYEKEKDYKKEKDPKLLYDRYEAKLKKIQIVIKDDGLKGLNDYREGEGKSIIKDFDGTIHIFNCLEPMHPTFSTIEIDVLIENIHVSVGLSNLKTTLEILYIVQSSLDAKEYIYFDQVIQEHQRKSIKENKEKVKEVLLEKVNQYRKEATKHKDSEELKVQRSESNLDDSDDDENSFMKQIKETVSQDVTKKVTSKRKSSSRKQSAQIKSEQIEGANMKVYVSIEKMIVSSPSAEKQDDGEIVGDEDELRTLKILKESQNQFSRYSDSDPFSRSGSKKLIEKSLVVQTNVDEFEGFQDAVSSINERIINELELQLNITKGLIDIVCELTDLRLSFCVPTVQKILKTVLNLQQVMVSVEDYGSNRKLFLIDTYTKVLNNVNDPEKCKLPQEKLIRKVFLNHAKQRELDPIKHKDVYEEGIQKMKEVLEQQANIEIQEKKSDSTAEKKKRDSSQNKDSPEKKDKQTNLLKQTKLITQVEEMVNKINVRANLRNFSIWIPLNPESEKSQVLALSFISNFGFNQEAQVKNDIDDVGKQIVHTDTIQNDQKISFSLSDFRIEMLQSSKDGERILGIQNEREVERDKSLRVKDIQYFMSQLLDPCRLSLSIDGQQKMKEQIQETKINIDVEPLHLQVGFKDLDFINIVLVQVQNNILPMLSEQEQEKKKKDEKLKQDQKEQNKVKEEEEKKFEKNLSQPREREKAKGSFASSNSSPQPKQFYGLYKTNTSKDVLKKDSKVTFINSHTQISLKSELIRLSMRDDTEEISKSLFSASFKGIYFNMISNKIEEDGEERKQSDKLHANYSDEYKLQNIQAIIKEFNINYFNQKSVYYEPLIEPYEVQFSLSQLSPYDEQNILLLSEKMLNVNGTFGMALTVRKIMDRIQDSLKQAEIYDKLNRDQELSKEEISFKDKWNKKLDQYDRSSIFTQKQFGYIFKNHTGLPVAFTVHDDQLDDDLTLTNPTRKPIKNEEMKSTMTETLDQSTENQLAKRFKKNQQDIASTKKYTLQDDKEQFIKDQDLQEQKLYVSNKKGLSEESTMSLNDALKLDFKIGNIQKLSNISIEGQGIYSFSIPMFEKQEIKQSTASDQGEEKKFIKKVGIVIANKTERTQRSVDIESQLLITNTNERDIVIFPYPKGQKIEQLDEKDQIKIRKGDVFRAPLTWFIQPEGTSIYIKGKNEPQKLFNDVYESFCYKVAKSKLDERSATICQIDDEYFVSMTVCGFKCLPEANMTNPLQYLVSFDPPMKVTNLNFHSLDIREASNDQKKIYSALAPKETSYLNQIDIKSKTDLYWNFFLNKNQRYSQKVSVAQKMNQTNQELFKFESSQPEDSFENLITFEVREVLYLDAQNYDNFEFRKREFAYSNNAHFMIYPKLMLVNRTLMPIISEKQIFEPFDNNFFNVKAQKVRFKVKGYKNSSAFDMTTIGLAGSFDLDLKKQSDIQNNQLTKLYAPEKLEFGIKIESGPSPFSKTTIVTIVPRYVVVNQLNFPFIFKQQGNKEQVLIKGGQTSFNLAAKANKLLQMREVTKQEMNFIMAGNKPYPDYAQEEAITNWSTPFQIDEVDDFQVAIQDEEQNDDNSSKEKQWYEPQSSNSTRRFVRVIVTSQDEATILIVLCNPLFQEYVIKNESKMTLKYGQMQESGNRVTTKVKSMAKHDFDFLGNCLEIEPDQRQPFVWADKTKHNRKIIFKCGNSSAQLNVDKAQARKLLKLEDGNLLSIEVSITGNSKKIKICDAQQIIEEKDTKELEKQHKLDQGKSINAQVQLRGLGLSFVDDQPKELLFLSVYGLNAQVTRRIEPTKNVNITETITQLKLEVQHLQIDNMINQIMPVVLAPTQPLQKQAQGAPKPILAIKSTKKYTAEDAKKEVDPLRDHENEDETPFIQLIVCIAEDSDKEEKSKVMRIQSVQFSIQEFIFQIETSIVNNNVKFVLELVKIFVDESQFEIQPASEENYEKCKMIKKEEQCEQLMTSDKYMKDDTVIKSKKIFMELIHLGAIKAIITFKLEKKAFEFDVSNPRKGFGILNVFYSLLSGIASISNSNIGFKELVLINTFASQETLISMITKNYARQGVRQFYKILGNSDLIGNPLGLVDKLGTGVLEFFNEPMKGLLKGPEEFVGGIGKGVKSLTTNVVGGSFDTVSKVTGSLYSVIKNVSGEKATEIKRPDHVFDGFYQGFKGAGIELFSGVKGLVTKPIEKTRQEGGKGFFKGVGSGLLGAISAPVTATLRIGTSVTQGVAQTANNIGNSGKVTIQNIQNTRFRPPRYINAKHVIESYDEDLALVSQSVQTLKEGKYARQEIKFFTILPQTKAHGEIVRGEHAQPTVLILTDEMMLYIKEEDRTGSKAGKVTVLFKKRFKHIVKCEVFKQQLSQEQKQSRMVVPEYTLKVTWHSSLKGTHYFRFVSDDYFRHPQVEGENEVRKSPANILRTCCL